MHLKKILFFALVFAPVIAYSTPGNITGTNCSIDAGGVLTCHAEALELNTGDLKNDGATLLDASTLPDGLKSIDLSVTGTTGNIYNLSGGLQLVASGDGSINGSVYMTGSVYNSTEASGTSNGTIRLEGGTIAIGGFVMNLSGTAGSYDPTSASVFIDANNQMSIGGDVWNNTADGATAEILAGNAVGKITLVSSNGISIGGDVVSFGGGINLSNAAGKIDIYGNLVLEEDNDGNGGTSNITSAGGLEVGHGGVSGVNISGGVTTFNITGVFGVLGDFLNDTGAGTTSITTDALVIGGDGFGNVTGGDLTNNSSSTIGITSDSLTVYGLISNTAGKMTIDADGVIKANNSVLSGGVGGIENTSGGYLSIISGDGMELGTDGLTLAGRLDIGYAAASPITAGNMEITNTANSSYTISSYGDIALGGSLLSTVDSLRIANGQSLEIIGLNNSTYIAVVLNGGGFGNLLNNGTFVIGDDTENNKIRSFASGAITSQGVSALNMANFTVITGDESGYALNDITVGAINNNAYSNIVLYADDGLTAGIITNAANAGTLDFTSENGAFSALGLANNSTSNVTVSSGSTLEIDGTLSNTAGGKIALLSTGETTITGNITNTNASYIFIGSDWNDADLDGVVDSGEISSLPAGALTIDAAFVNSAYFHGEVSGLTTINAVDTGAATDFYLKTGTLDLDAAGYSSLLHNTIDQIYLELTSTTDNTDLDGIDINDLDDINVAEIVNGSLVATDANMFISAENITVSGLVQNLGESMTIEANGGDISIDTLQNRTLDGVFVSGGTADFDILTTGSVTIVDTVSNFGTLTINGGAGVTLTNGLDNRANMQVLTGASGKLSLSGNINNYGVATDYTVSCGIVSGSINCTGRDLYIWSHQLESSGSLDNNEGLGFVYMNSAGGLVGTSHFDSINANGGRLDLGGNGTMLVQNDIDIVSGAYVNVFGLSGITSVDGEVSIAGDITSGQQYIDMPTLMGDFNVSSTTFTLDGADGISVAGSVKLQESTGHTLTLKSDVGGTTIAISGTLQASNGNSAVGGNNTIILRGNTTAASLSQSQYGIIRTYGSTLAISGAASIAGGIDFNGTLLGYLGLEAMSATNSLAFSASSLTTSGIEVGVGKTLGITTSGSITSSGTVRNDGTLNLSANGYVIDASITNNGTMTLTNTNTSALDLFDISNLSGNLTINNAGRAVLTGAITTDGGQVSVNSSSLTIGSLTQNSGQVSFNGSSMRVVATGGGSGLIDLESNLAIGTTTDSCGLKVSASGMTLISEDLNLDEDSIIHYTGSATLEIQNSFTANAFRSDAAAGTLTIRAGVVPVLGTVLKTDTFEILGDGLDATNTFVNNGTTNIYANNISITNGIVNDGTLSAYVGNAAEFGDVSNSGTINVSAENANSDAVFGDIVNEGEMSIDWWGTAGSDDAAVVTNSLSNTIGTLTLNGYELKAEDDVVVGSIYQDDTNHTAAGSVSVLSNDYTITMAEGKSLTVNTDIIGSTGNTITFNTNILTVGRNIDAGEGTVIFSAADYLSDCLFGLCPIPNMPDDPTYDIATGDWSPWMKADVTGDISGGTEFIGVGRMDVGGDYTFNDDSKLTVAVLPKDLEGTYAGDDSSYTFYGKISETGGGVALDLTGARPIVDVGGKFTLDLSTPSEFQTSELPNIVLQDGNIGLTLFDAITEDTVVWLVKAGDGVESVGHFLPRNLAVYFCNADGTKCFNYMNSLNSSGDPTELPVYLRVDSSTGDPDNMDSMFAVFDTRYGGPLLMYNLETEVQKGNYDGNTVTSAGVIDDWLTKGIIDAGFLGENNPIDVIPAAFDGTEYEDMAQALYDRMQAYRDELDTDLFSEFARLFVPVEAGQVAHIIESSDRMVLGSIQKRMVDEALWTRNRVKTKLWTDFDYAFQEITDSSDEDPLEGTRMFGSAGYDIQITPEVIVGFNAGLAISENTGNPDINLSYGTTAVSGTRKTTVDDNAINFGGYLLAKISNSMQLYGAADFSAHSLSISREVDYIENTDAETESSSITGEVGLVHSLAAQYVVGVLSARLIQNDGFAFSENLGSGSYSDINYNAYTSFAPGYSVLFQKRVYITPTFMMRPNLSIGAEYEMVDGNGIAEYTFLDNGQTYEFDTENDPLWITGKVGVEFLSVSGLQFGLGYEYHYNAAVKSHNIHLGASYRF